MLAGQWTDFCGHQYLVGQFLPVEPFAIPQLSSVLIPVHSDSYQDAGVQRKSGIFSSQLLLRCVPTHSSAGP